ncbi:MAG TPA: response regulator [Candidatus Omnitrophota bacterium]|nr:response regulator [Candidatus Omnitrophota bacterium]HRY86026.1 response regulator [Candidatus Omnitrophota bacterium]
MAKVLIADDEPDVLLIVSERLRRNGHEVEYAPDGNQAIQKADQGTYDLFIFDIRMPGHTGYEVCEHVKNSEKNAQTPVLLISAFPEEKAKWRQSKADAFLAKPFETKHLIAKVDQLLHKISNGKPRDPETS